MSDRAITLRQRENRGAFEVLAAAGRAWRAACEPRLVAPAVIALAVIPALWMLPARLSIDGRLTLTVFVLAVIGWTMTHLNDAQIALAAIVPLLLRDAQQNGRAFAALGDPLIWLLVATFVVAAAARRAGLSERFAVALLRRARTVRQLFYLGAIAMVGFAFLVPATSARAAVMAPVFQSLARSVRDARVTRALSILFPSAILLGAVGSLTGAGAHLVALDLIAHAGDQRLDYLGWAMLGAPFALASCLIAAWVIMRMHLGRDLLARRVDFTGDETKPAEISPQAWRVIAVIVFMVLGWATKGWHGVSIAAIALCGAVIVTLPGVGSVSFKDCMREVEWSLILFMAATMALGEALMRSGAAEWMVDGLYHLLLGDEPVSQAVAVLMLSVLGLSSHLLIASRSARVAVIMPITLALAQKLDLAPTAAAFLMTAATGYCLTFTVSAKPLAMFSQEEGAFRAADLLRLSAVLAPIHVALLGVFAWLIWPLLGLEFAPAR